MWEALCVCVCVCVWGGGGYPQYNLVNCIDHIKWLKCFTSSLPISTLVLYVDWAQGWSVGVILFETAFSCLIFIWNRYIVYCFFYWLLHFFVWFILFTRVWLFICLSHVIYFCLCKLNYFSSSFFGVEF